MAEKDEKKDGEYGSADGVVDSRSKWADSLSMTMRMETQNMVAAEPVVGDNE